MKNYKLFPSKYRPFIWLGFCIIVLYFITCFYVHSALTSSRQDIIEFIAARSNYSGPTIWIKSYSNNCQLNLRKIAYYFFTLRTNELMKTYVCTYRTRKGNICTLYVLGSSPPLVVNNKISFSI